MIISASYFFMHMFCDELTEYYIALTNTLRQVDCIVYALYSHAMQFSKITKGNNLCPYFL